MTKSEAIHALYAGKQVTHRFMSPDEFVYRNSNHELCDESGFPLDSMNFWHLRHGSDWDSGWYVYIPEQPEMQGKSPAQYEASAKIAFYTFILIIIVVILSLL
jgi:hypothetical protein